ncbi:RICIN domain-containing protein [Streptomyces sp. SP18BB07]|uniref:RICIN domain-containing protein n=1 Tax=Streptomyces sp. SP18BB07 TaxID=3002522 RepID=UPI002E75A528|nr:RICIN domain-containing protein [Streptomyces sp. SP18BB07]MEE1765111.1 RICIN domain-containing protein [Streptomyces sp. SP18BB07]
MLMLSGLLFPGTSYAANAQLGVDLSSTTGDIAHGASGFLYGMGNAGVTTDNVLQPLHPQQAAQKPQGGLQHPSGDVFDVAPQYLKAGTKEIQIYMQDIYRYWPYEEAGLTDYLGKVDDMVAAVKADPNYGKYVYVPFNEPDWIWYGGMFTNATVKAQFFDDWKTVYNRIRSLDPSAKIAGPGFSVYNNQTMADFLAYAKANNVVPDVITWHELQNNFFTDYYNHYDHWRGVESSLSTPKIPIVINEYTRATGDLGIPGQLIQWMTRLENTKVSGDLAYWVTEGTLNGLATRNNEPTGAWWLYNWYGEMTGKTVTVTPPTQNGSLQGIATLDSAKKQARVIFGGTSGDTDVAVQGFGSTSGFGSTVHAIVQATNSTGTEDAAGRPAVVLEGDFPVTDGKITVTVPGMAATSAYQMIITPGTSTSSADVPTRYQAEYADLTGSARVTYGSNTGYTGTYFVDGYSGSSNASTNFVVSAPSNGYYDVTLRYAAGPHSGAPANRSTRVTVNGTKLTDLALTGTANWNTWNTKTVTMYLTQGINRIDYGAYTSDESDNISVDSIDVTTSTSGTTASYEAEASGNTLGGTAATTSDTAASGGQYVHWLGNGAGNTLQFNGITAASAGLHRLVVTYANGDNRGDGGNDYNIINRYADITVNGGTPQRVYFRNTRGWSNYWTTTVNVTLNAGTNTIKFGNSSAYAPNIDKVQVASAISTGGTSYLKLQNRATGLYVDGGGRTTNGSAAGQWAGGTTANQEWTVVPDGSWIRLKNRATGLYLDGLGATVTGSATGQWSDRGDTSQQWMEVTAGAHVRFKNRATELYADGMNRTANGSDLGQWSDSTSANQQFRIVPQ